MASAAAFSTSDRSTSPYCALIRAISAALSLLGVRADESDAMYARHSLQDSTALFPGRQQTHTGSDGLSVQYFAKRPRHASLICATDAGSDHATAEHSSLWHTTLGYGQEPPPAIALDCFR